MIETALYDATGIYQKDIARQQGISIKYLDQIIAALKNCGLITKAEDHRQGYVLAVPASKITIYDIYRAFEPELGVVPCIPDEGYCNKKSHCAAVHFWSGLNQHMKKYIQSVTLADLDAI
jgi:Rrf2 family protein